MGDRGARCGKADVTHSWRASRGEGGEVAIFVRVTLDGNPSRKSHHQYVLETLLSTIGVPFEFAAPALSRGRTQDAPTQSDGTPYLELISGNISAGAMPTIVTLPDHPAGFPAEGGPPEPPAPAEFHSSLDSVFAALARTEEYSTNARDQYERFLWAHTTARPAEAAVRPNVSEYAQALLASIRETAARAGVPMIRKEVWPHAKPMAACLTHDVDAIRRGRLPRGVAAKDVRAAVCTAVHGRLGQAAGQVAAIVRTASGPNPYWTFDRIAAMEKEHGFRSTYFVMAGHLHPQDPAYDPSEPMIARLMRRSVDSGCEVALHGSFASYMDAGSLLTQKAHLEAVLGEKVAGHRNHVLRFRVPDSWRIQQQVGFSYDATLGFADREGYRGGHAFPFHPYDAEAEQSLEILELPLAVMDVTIQKYRGLRGDTAWQAVEVVLEQTMGVNGLATLLWHNDTLYDPDYPGCGRLYEEALRWLTSKGVWVASCRDVNLWWRARDKIQLLPLPGEQLGWNLVAGEAIDGLVLRLSIPDPRAVPQVSGPAATIERDGADYLLEFDHLPSGSHVEIRC